MSSPHVLGSPWFELALNNLSPSLALMGNGNSLPVAVTNLTMLVRSTGAKFHVCIARAVPVIQPLMVSQSAACVFSTLLGN